MNKQIIIVGGFHEIIELCEELDYSIVGIIDNNLKTEFLNYPVIGSDKDARILLNKYGHIPLVISPDSPLIRKRLFDYYSNIGFTFSTIISSGAKISKSATIGLGSVIQHGVNISANTRIGSFVKLNTNSNIMHDCSIGDFVTIAPNAVVLGRINIGLCTYIGSNSTILPEKKIAANVIVGAGAVVTKDIIENDATYAGVPAKKLSYGKKP
ncbi:NeuD/PglB/VioB family sugar acetyltransferase [Draconibacterium sediminis]|uniref:NeuD/PglB/VioB family sugar acetyltransferase n=1 Tax=Draconibacterium sediminis TaxID=1544798 RepID=UPI0026E98024|nr:NeuD/PglB/VioB family sugar acetyltransferase [Draconibacterium sediminis]